MLLADLLAALVRPNRDPREDFPPPTFRREIMKLDDLEPGMQLTAVVLNVVDFGAFVDIGLTESGLIHISRLADRFIRDPHAVVSVGDKLPVWVVEIDKGRRRVSLTAIAPGSEKPREKRGRAPAQKKTPRTVRKDQGQQGDARKAKRKGKRAGSKPPPPPKVVKKAKPDPPITKKMIEGNEPMRTFGDLAQFYEKKSTDEEPGDKK
ncbi:MAG: S1 RNA-binding domain-containing protein [Pirellulaceae bacterium]|jgi:uncharacterized protein|nr:S1 RNA-binding domain-containing protein [Pirellulaceae bacterium]